MKEIKDPKKNSLYYYLIVMLIMLVVNAIVVPHIQSASIKEVSYNVFMDLTEQKKINQVQIDSNQILFTESGSDSVYKTGLVNDPDLTQRLYDAGVDFRTDIQKVSTPLERFLWRCV